jgi:DNA repair protein RecO (recombination protein O)
MKVELQPAFILHHRAYRETSLLLEILTLDHGRVSLIARGVRTARSKLRAVLQPFTPLWVSWYGKSELMTLTSAEPSSIPFALSGDCLLGAFYLNEVLMRVLPKHDPCSTIYSIYSQTLVELQRDTLQEKTLRLFEKKLLSEMGYGLQLAYSFPDKLPFSPEKQYYFHPDQGFEAVENMANASGVFSGKSLLALTNELLDEADVLQEVKRIMRLALAPLLGDRPLNTRKLFL